MSEPVWHRIGDEPATVLQIDVRRRYCDQRKRCWEQTGSPLARDHVLEVFDGFLYRRSTDDTDGADERFRRHRERAARHQEAGTTYYAAEIAPEVEAIVRRLRRHPAVSRPLRVLVDHLIEAAEAYAYVMGDLHWRMAGSVDFDWASTFADITEEPPEAASELLGGLTSDSTRLVRSLDALAAMARDDPGVRRAVEARDLAAVPDSEAGRRFTQAFRGLLRRYGQRTGQGWGSVQGFGAPTWNMRPDIPLAMVASYMDARAGALRRVEEHARRVRRNATRRYRRRLVGDARRRFDEAHRLAMTYARQMEDHNHLMDNATTGVLHEAIDLVGRRLVDDGILDEVDDVRHLSVAELGDLADGVLGATRARALVDDRRRAYAASAAGEPPPKTIGSAPTAPSMEAQGIGLDGDVLHGVAASPGRYTGRARVAAVSPAPPDIDEGDVLVAVDAGPAWTPIFPLLGAVVLDAGATFQHAAVMAREFGIPAVLGTRQATTAIEDGQTVTVDGDAGTVDLSSAR